MRVEDSRKLVDNKTADSAVWSPSVVVPRRGKDGKVPLSFSQRQLWLLDRIMPASAAYSIPTVLRFESPLDTNTLHQAINQLVQRHEVLRTRFVETEGEPAQVIEPELIIEIQQEDLSGIHAAQREPALEKRLMEESRCPFDLALLPLLRVRLFHLGEGRQALFIVLHHIIADGWSLPIFFRELAILYEACRRREASPLPELPLQYGDYAVWQQDQLESGELRSQLEYWRKNLENASDTLALPADFPRPEKPKFEGAGEFLELSRAMVQEFKRLGRQAGATFHMAMLTAYSVVLHRYCGQDEILIGTPTANREQEELQELIGFFVNMLVIRVDLTGNPSFMDLLNRVRDKSVEAYAHQGLPFDLLVEKLRPERKLNKNPLFQATFSVVNSMAPDEQIAAWPPFKELNNSTFKFDMGAVVFENSLRCGLNLGYNPELFRQETCARFKRHFQRLLEQIIANPQAGVSTLSMLLPEEEQVLHNWQNTQVDYPREKRIEEIFQMQVKKTPDAPALIYPSRTLTYQQLDDAANCVAGSLRRLGVWPGMIVGICMERSWQFIAAIVGILKAGGVYLPLDPAYPSARLQFMVDDSKAHVVLTQASLMGKLPCEAQSCRVLQYEDVSETPGDLPAVSASAEALAYVIYTSGSTGSPKGTQIPHHGVTRLVCNTNYMKFGPDSRIGQVSNSSFDAATFEIWGALLNGGCIAGVSREESLSPELLAGRIRESRITAMFLTTALFNQFAASNESGAFSELEYLLFGGETAAPKWVREVLKYSPPKNLLNVYGPTENTTFSTWQLVRFVPSESSTVPIGKPLANTETYVLDRNLMPVVTGVAGELYLGGDGLAQGYINRPGLTAEKFVPNPFSLRGSERLYRTGDLVKYTSTGEIEFIGRTDQQVKIRGFRIEPGEVESLLQKNEKVKESIVLVRDKGGEKQLIAYVTVEEGTSKRDLRQYLKDHVPDYMVPAQFVFLQDLPLNENGKIDRYKLLEEMSAFPGEEPEEQYVAPRNDLEQRIAEIWSDLLGVEKIGVYDNIFELGGHSLLLIAILARMKRQLPFATGTSVTDLFLYPTIDSLVEFIGPRESAGPAA